MIGPGAPRSVRQLQAHLSEADPWRLELQAEHGEKLRGSVLVVHQKTLFQPKLSTATGFNSEADDLT